MDPNQTLIDADTAITAADYGQAAALLFAYYQWRLRGGAEPRAVRLHPSVTPEPGDEVASSLSNTLLDRCWP